MLQAILKPDRHARIRELGRVLEKNPKNRTALYMHACAHGSLINRPECVACGMDHGKSFLELGNVLVEQYPDWFRSYFIRGSAHMNYNDHQSAVADYTESIRLRP